MKCRTSFVTNSSSSSFILAFENKKSLIDFYQYCECNDYEEFYELIENLSSDYLVFDNDTNEKMPVRPLIEKVRYLPLGVSAKFELKKLYDEDYKIKPYGSVSIKINRDNESEELNFEEIYEEDKYSIRILSNKENRDKNAALEFLNHCYSFDFKYKILNEKFKYCYPGDKAWKQKQEYENSEEFKQLIEEYLKNNHEYKERKQKIIEAETIIKGTIWDTSGGLLEWAIRNGFIESEFPRECVICYNVG